MIERYIDLVIRHRALVVLAIIAAVLASVFAIRSAAMDAIPDTSEPQVIVYAKWARSPQLLESEVTEPVIRALLGAADVRSIRATSHMGYSFIYVIVKDRARIAAARAMITDRLNAIRTQLPADSSINLGPNAGSIGWIYEYALIDREGLRDPREMRQLNESQVKPALQAVPGVAEVASVGGLEKQYQLKVFPPLLAAHSLPLDRLLERLRQGVQEAGGRVLEVNSRDYQIRGVLATDSVDKLESMVLGQGRDGQAVHVRDVGYFQVGYDQRRSIADLNGKGEVLGGILVMQQGRNVLEVMGQLRTRLAEVRAALPEGVQIVTAYDRSELIWSTLRHFIATLLYELAVVIAVTALFLRNARSAAAPVLILLLSVLLTFLPLAVFGQTINLFSLAGLFIAIGEMVDATIVIVENCTAELAGHPGADAAERRGIVLRSIGTVARPLTYSLLIILASFLPVFFLSPKEARMFDPLAFSKTFGMAFSTLLTLTLLPLLMLWVFRHGRAHSLGGSGQRLVSLYRLAVQGAIRFRYAFLALSLAALVLAVLVFSGFRRDFMPEMEEGSILYMPTTLPGVPAREAGWILQRMDAKLAAFPEVANVFGKLGRADTATDSAPVSMIESTVLLKPLSQWRTGMTKARLIAEMDQSMQLLGFANSWVQPISARVVMQDTGIQTPAGLKVKGPDVAVIEGLGRKIEGILRGVPGTQAVIAERISSGYYINVDFDPNRLASTGLSADQLMPIVQYAIGGDNVVYVKDASGTRIPLSVQYSGEYLDTLAKIQSLPVVLPGGGTVPLQELADVSVRNLPEMLRNDNGQPAGYVYVYLKGGITATDYVGQARGVLARQLTLPPGYSVEWTGDYQNAAAARARLQVIIPITLVIIFGLLLLAFRSVADSVLIMMSVPFALVGGVFLQWRLGYPMTTAVVIGYIALFAVAIQTGIIMIIFIRQALARRIPTQSYMDAVLEGSVSRLRPKLMTVAATVLSLFPVMFSSGAGIEIMKPIATPTIGGMLSSTIYVLFLIPCLFAIGEDLRRWQARAQGSRATHEEKLP